ncbi:MAG: YegS/Rv2252/BmrU family lipid kinase [Desulfobacterales bacterium]|jgi:lipid kinase YegS
MMRSESRKFCVIFDQRAQNDDGLQQGVQKLQVLGHSVFTKKIDEPREAARYAGAAAEQGVDTVVAVGGDGMLNLVVNGILREKSDVPCSVGLIPFGTGNDFAGASGIPSDSILDALDIVIRVIPVPIDVGQVNETFFVNVILGGFPAEAATETSRKAKAFLGKFAYFVTGLANIGSLDAKDMHFTAPGFEWEGPVYAFGLGNSRQAGGGFTVSPKAVIDDGMLDLVIIPQSEAGLVTLVSDYARMNRFDDTDRIIYRQVPWLILASRETLYLNLDGESIKGKNFRFQVHSRMLPFCLPTNSPVLIPPSAEG